MCCSVVAALTCTAREVLGVGGDGGVASGVRELSSHTPCFTVEILGKRGVIIPTLHLNNYFPFGQPRPHRSNPEATIPSYHKALPSPHRDVQCTNQVKDTRPY